MRKIEDADEKLIAEGRRALFESGYAAVNVKHIASACNMGIGTFYSRFGSKKGFVLEILADDCRKLDDQIEEALTSAAPLKKKLEAVTLSIGEYRKQTSAVIQQIPLNPEEHSGLAAQVETRSAEIAERIVRENVSPDNLAAGLNVEDIQSYIAQFFTSEATSGAMPFANFIACLSSMIGKDAAAQLSSFKLTRKSIERVAEMDPGAIEIYLYHEGALEKLYTSPYIPQALGPSYEMGKENASGNALDLIAPEDRAYVTRTLAECIEDEKRHDIYCRLQYRKNIFDWIHVVAKSYGRIDGDPVLVASFSSVSTETDIYQEILDNTDRMIYVCDCETYDILYANKLVRTSKGGPAGFDASAPCYKAIRGKDAPCADCRMHEANAAADIPYFQKLEEDDGVALQIVEKPLRWHGRKAYVHYIDNISPLRQAERDAVKHRHMYEAAVEDAKLVVWEYDIANHRIVMSDNNFTEYDYRKFSLPKVIENAPWALVPYIDEDSVDAFLEMYRKIDDGAPKASCEVWYKLTPGQEPRCERITHTNSFDNDGRPTIAFGMGQNITASKTAEIRYEQAYSQIAKNSETIASFRLNLTENWAGDGHGAIPPVLGQHKESSTEEFFASFAKVIATDEARTRFFDIFDREKLLEGFKQGKTDYVFEYPIIYDDGTRHWNEGHLFLLQNPATGNIEGTAYSIAIDDRKHSELMAKVFSNAMFGFTILLDLATGKILFGGQSGPQAKEKYRNEDYTPAMEAALREMMPPDEIDDAIAAHSIENIRTQLNHCDRFVLTLVTKDERHLRWNIAYVDREDSIVLIVREDITDTFRKQQEMIDRLEKALDSAERANQAEQTFLSNMSHDMRTPLNGILGFTDLALKTQDLAQRQDYLQKIDASGKLMLDLINDVLDLSKVASGKMELHVQTINARKLFDAVLDSLKMHAQERHLTLSAEIDPAYPRFILADRLRLQQIALNLLSNAIKYTPDGGTVAFELHIWEKPEDLCNTLFVVKDSGIGMSKEFQERMFEPFSQEHQSRMYGLQGTGLGLSIVANLVDLMGGRIEVDSVLSKGTKCSVYLPLQPTAADHADKKDARGASADISGRHILLVEDNELNREIAVTILRERGKAKVDCAADGREGVERFKASKPGYYDAIIMDIRMPIMGGIEASRTIRALDRPDAKTIPLIAMTADAFAEDVRDCLDAGMNAHVAKPINPELLFQTLAAHMDLGFSG